MEISLKTASGATVEIKPTYFVADLPHPTDMQLKLTAPVLEMEMESDSQAELKGKSSFETRFLMMKDDTSTFGVFLIISGSHLTALLADMQNPMIQQWSRTAHKVGYLPMLLKRHEGASLLEFPRDDDTAEAFASLNPQFAATAEATQRAVSATFALAQSIEELPRLLPADVRLQSIHVHVIASEFSVAHQTFH